MARRVALRVLMTWLAVAVILGTTSAVDQSEFRMQRLKTAINIETISTDSGPKDPKSFLDFIEFIKSSFPKTQKEIENKNGMVKMWVRKNYSLLYYVVGSNASLERFLLTSHYDVVPADPNTWSHPPFYVRPKGNLVFGRGTLDGKSTMMAMLESLEQLLQSGFEIKRGFYLAFGHDQEVDGGGAMDMAKLVDDRELPKLKFILHEGTPILANFTSFVTKPVAIIGVAEKGFSRFTLSTVDIPEQSWTPSSKPSILKFANIIARLDEHPYNITLKSGLERIMVANVVPQFLQCFDRMLTNTTFFNPFLSNLADRSPFLNAMLRTTTAFTMLQGGHESNTTTMTIYHSIYPSETTDAVYVYDKNMVGNDTSIEFDTVDTSDPSAISPHDDNAFGFSMIKKSILHWYPGAIVTPGLAIGSADSRRYRYRKLSDQVYYMSPFLVNLEDLQTIHADDERISKDNYENLISFYIYLMHLSISGD